MSETRPTREGGYRLDDADSVVVAKRVFRLLEAAQRRKADLARHLQMHASHVGNLFSTKPGVQRRWQRWHVVGTAEYLGITEAELLKGTKVQNVDELGAFEWKPIASGVAVDLDDEPDDLNRVSVLRAKLRRLSPELVRHVDRHQVRDEVIAVLASSHYRTEDTSDEALAQIVADAEQDLVEQYARRPAAQRRTKGGGAPRAK